jgi:nitrate/TMAO reductase-like tetraheme cytochrome c subunit
VTGQTPSPGSAGQARQSIWRNWYSLAGAIIASGSLFAFLFLFTLDMTGSGKSNPYMGILCYVVAPFFLACGLALVIGGAVRRRRELAILRGLGAPQPLAIDLSRERDRRILGVFGGLTMVYLLLTAVGSYQTYEYTESDTFCGMVCHTVMGPELTAYHRFAHARVACVDCHVGEGAASYVNAKINGVRQLYAITFNTFSRPIPAPIHNLRPARETCEHCHWPEKHTGNLERTLNRYLADDANTPYSVRLLLKVGGSGSEHGRPGGIHWHTSRDTKVEYYATDDKRQTIPWVRVTDKSGAVTVYRKKGYKDNPDPRLVRQMDCIDCHNRPAHRYNSPDDAMDEAIYLGRVDRALPAVKRTAVDLLAQPYATRAEGEARISDALRKKYAGAKGVDGAVAEVLDIYRNNFFPEMKVDWSKYPENIGHLDSPGCFRCHDGDHKSESGGPVPATACDSCHVILAQGSGADLAKLAPNGVAFKHPSTDIDGLGLSCSDCHNGKNQEN